MDGFLGRLKYAGASQNSTRTGRRHQRDCPRRPRSPSRKTQTTGNATECVINSYRLSVWMLDPESLCCEHQTRAKNLPTQMRSARPPGENSSCSFYSGVFDSTKRQQSVRPTMYREKSSCQGDCRHTHVVALDVHHGRSGRQPWTMRTTSRDVTLRPSCKMYCSPNLISTRFEVWFSKTRILLTQPYRLQNHPRLTPSPSPSARAPPAKAQPPPHQPSPHPLALSLAPSSLVSFSLAPSSLVQPAYNVPA